MVSPYLVSSQRHCVTQRTVGTDSTPHINDLCERRPASRTQFLHSKIVPGCSLKDVTSNMGDGRNGFFVDSHVKQETTLFTAALTLEYRPRSKVKAISRPNIETDLKMLFLLSLDVN